MTTLQKIVKYLAMAFAIFLSASIITGICGALFTATYFISGRPSGEMTEQSVGSNYTSLKVDISASELDKGIGEATLDGIKMGDDSVYGAGNNTIEIDGGVGELKIIFKAKLDEESI